LSKINSHFSASSILGFSWQAHLGPLGVLSDQLEQQSDMKLSLPQMDVIICCLTKEIQALQKELTKLAKV
jgi:hypothetical protein